jgi:8-oxo-dGTP pyrophosphatase MutT (NUDIX family)
MTAPASPPVPLDSATVALLREPAPGRLEVLLVARHAESRAFAGAHVFPGGLLDPRDRAPELARAMAPHMTPGAARTVLGDSLDPADALAFFVATIRELFEEAGILLADVDGEPLRLAAPAIRDRFALHRRALVDGRCSFSEIVAEERLVLRASDLRYFSRWITPVHAPRRYDARFFVAPVPPDQAPLHDDRETTSAEWMTAADALAAAAAGTVVLTPPTARTLEELIDLGGLAAVLASAASRHVTPILPKVVQIGERMGVLYPGDVDYDGTEPGAALPAERSGPLNRVIMDDAGWRRFRGLRP